MAKLIFLGSGGGRYAMATQAREQAGSGLKWTM